MPNIPESKLRILAESHGTTMAGFGLRVQDFHKGEDGFYHYVWKGVQFHSRITL